jgi:hypothetical protein
MGTMWRAWGILLLLPRQDLGPPFTSEAHEMSLRPPTGWTGRAGAGPFIARFTPAELEATPADGEKRVPPWGLTLSHLHYRTTPTPLESFVKQAKSHVEREFKGAKILEEKNLVISGRKAYRLVFEFENTVQLKTVVPRTHLEGYLLDASFLKSDESRFRKIAEASIESFKVVPVPLSGEETGADFRTADLLAAAKVQPGLLGERWHSIHLGSRKTGHMRTLLSDAGGTYGFEVEVHNDFGEGNVDSTIVRGSFSPDAREQKIDFEQSKTNDRKEHWQFRSSASIHGGVLKASRDMNGIKEEKTFKVEAGVLFPEVADVVRRSLVWAGKGNFLLKIISPFGDEWTPEMVEVNDKESLELDGARREAHILFCREDRRRNLTYYVGPDGGLIRMGGVQETISIRMSTKEAALDTGGK